MNQTEFHATSQRSARQTVAWLVAGGMLLVLNWGIVKLYPWTTGASDATRFLALTLTYGAAGMGLLAAMAWLWRSAPGRVILAWILVASLAMRLLAFSEPPRFESDFHRYLWDGAVTAHGYNPFTIRPADVYERRTDRLPQDSDFASLAEAGRYTLPNINHPNLTTIYPPVAQGFFALAYWISPFSTDALRAVFLGAEVGIVLLLLTMLRSLGLPLHWVTLYWWNPIAVKEFYVSAHMDGLAALFALAALSAVVWRWRRTGIVLLGVAIGVKLWPLVLAPILLRYGAKSWRQVLGGMVLLVLVTGVLTWPLVASLGHESQSGVNAYAHQWSANAGLYSVIDWSARSLHDAGLTFWSDPLQLPRRITAGIMVLWMMVLASRRLPDTTAVTRWSALAVGGLFLLSPSQFPWYYTWVLPLLVLAPVRALLLYTALLPLYHQQLDHPWLLWIEHLPVWLLIGWTVCRWRRPGGIHQSARTGTDYTPPASVRVAVVIPALNEERAIGQVLAAIPSWVSQVVVADNGSSDGTAAMARDAGATIVLEMQRGYGAACLAGMAALDQPDLVAFLDGDFSDRPQEIGRLVEPIVRDEADMVMGSRVLGGPESGSLTPQQRFGNALACGLIRLLYGVRYSDLGPFRAIRYSSLQRLQMDDRDYGWTVQMQVRAARQGLRVAEGPVSYRRRVGVSKISGTIRGVIGAGTKIISTIFREGLRPSASRSSTSIDRLIVFARYPEPGRAKTRLIPLLGPKGAALLHRQLVRITLDTARRLGGRRDVLTEVRSTGATTRDLGKLFGTGVTYQDQGEGDLGQRMRRAAADSLARGAHRVILIGTDCPLLTSDRLDEAFAALDTHDVVIGPATDGGYCLIGAKADHAALFADIAWGGPTVLTQTLEVCRRLGLNFTLLPPLPDLDTPADLAAWASARLAPAHAKPRLSVIIPARNEQDHLAATIASVLTAQDVEIIVADGLSTDQTVEIAAKFGVNVAESEPSRGLRLNVGARRARGDVILFLHADTILPPDYVSVVRQTLGWPGVSAGAFDLAIDAPGIPARVIEGGVRVRSRFFGRPYGDQVLFMSAQTYSDCGGFPDLPYVEDCAMLARLKSRGQIRIAFERVSTSARRWESRGWLRTTLLHQWLIVRHHLFGPRTGASVVEHRVEMPCGNPPMGQA